MRGRALFNGSAYCADCHGIDGDLTRRPDKGNTTRLIEQLHPPPADLRRPEGLTLRTDDERMQIIKKGHRGTAMFPHHGLLQQDIHDLVAYLEILRREGHTDTIPHQP